MKVCAAEARGEEFGVYMQPDSPRLYHFVHKFEDTFEDTNKQNQYEGE